MKDKTLKTILKHWTDPEMFQGEFGTLDLPFDIEAFCIENDARIEAQAACIKDLWEGKKLPGYAYTSSRGYFLKIHPEHRQTIESIVKEDI